MNNNPDALGPGNLEDYIKSMKYDPDLDCTTMLLKDNRKWYLDGDQCWILDKEETKRRGLKGGDSLNFKVITPMELQTRLAKHALKSMSLTMKQMKELNARTTTGLKKDREHANKD